jgi:cobalt-zinc-cadmium efflux system protein
MSHNHNHLNPSVEKINRAFIIGIGLNALFTGIEFIMGALYNSLALISDATHNLSDVGSLILSLIGIKLAQKSASKSYTYGFKKVSILASLINAILLVVVLFGIIKEAIERFANPPEITGTSIILVASIGVIINSISAYLFYKDQKSDINIKGAFIHLLVDALVSVGVVISGIVIYYTGWNIIDPLISIGIAIVIIFSTWKLLFESIRLTLGGVPKDIDIDKITKLISEINGVKDVHHIHIWAISSSMNALTAHIKVDPGQGKTWNRIKELIKTKLAESNIAHTTLELETDDINCKTNDCD